MRALQIKKNEKKYFLHVEHFEEQVAFNFLSLTTSQW